MSKQIEVPVKQVQSAAEVVDNNKCGDLIENANCWKCKQKVNFKCEMKSESKGKNTAVAKGKCPNCGGNVTKIISLKASKVPPVKEVAK